MGIKLYFKIKEKKESFPPTLTIPYLYLSNVADISHRYFFFSSSSTSHSPPAPTPPFTLFVFLPISLSPIPLFHLSHLSHFLLPLSLSLPPSRLSYSPQHLPLSLSISISLPTLPLLLYPFTPLLLSCSVRLQQNNRPSYPTICTD